MADVTLAYARCFISRSNKGSLNSRPKDNAFPW